MAVKRCTDGVDATEAGLPDEDEGLKKLAAADL